MRSMKWVGLVLALATVSGVATAQGGYRPVGINEVARAEARREMGMRRQMARRLHARQFLRHQRGVAQAGRRGLALGRPVGMRGAGRMGFAAGRRAGLRAGMRLGMRAGMRRGLNATPAQREFAGQFRAQRESIRAQVQAGTLTREAARAQMQAWAREHRPE